MQETKYMEFVDEAGNVVLVAQTTGTVDGNVQSNVVMTPPVGTTERAITEEDFKKKEIKLHKKPTDKPKQVIDNPKDLV